MLKLLNRIETRVFKNIRLEVPNNMPSKSRQSVVLIFEEGANSILEGPQKSFDKLKKTSESSCFYEPTDMVNYRALPLTFFDP